MHAHGNPADLEAFIARMEAPERAEWQKPDAVVERLALGRGAVVCEIGAGPGYFALRLGRAVGEGGVVYAVDVVPRILEVLRDRIEGAGARNVVPVLGLGDDPLIPEDACDLILIVNTLHHFSEPVAFLRRLERSLGRDGRLVNIDFHKRPTAVGPPVEHRVDRGDFLAIAGKAGLEVVAEHDLLPHQYFIELAPRQR
jgi:ubiquinone/menaquinone biosynthesis C-methylase UbiE